MLEDHKDEQPPEIKFTYKNRLLYYTDEEYNQLVISKSLLTKVFHLVHNENSHAKLHWSYQKLMESVYVHCLVHHLKKYLQHCPTCQVNQTKRHQPYRALQPITFPAIPF